VTSHAAAGLDEITGFTVNVSDVVKSGGLSERYWKPAEGRVRGTGRPPDRAAHYEKTLAAFFCSAPIASI
jgi:hypothetical protein